MATAAHRALTLTIAIAYGGREEIADAVQALLRERIKGGEAFEDVVKSVTPEAIGRYLYAPDLPDRDLIIRTSGEVRLLGSLLWQSAYSEFYFGDVHWPAFRKIDFPPCHSGVSRPRASLRAVTHAPDQGRPGLRLHRCLDGSHRAPAASPDGSRCIRRVVHHQVPPKVEYCLTNGGQALCPALDALMKWVALRDETSDPARRPERVRAELRNNLARAQRMADLRVVRKMPLAAA